MLDIRFLRENPEVVKQNIKNKFQDNKLPLVDEVIALDLRNREIKQEVEALRVIQYLKKSGMQLTEIKEFMKDNEENNYQLGISATLTALFNQGSFSSINEYALPIRL